MWLRHWSFAQLGDVYQDCKRAYEKTPKNDWVIVEQKNPRGSIILARAFTAGLSAEPSAG